MVAHELLSRHMDSNRRRWCLREDTLETLARLVQHGIVLQLQRSLNLVAALGGRVVILLLRLLRSKKQAECRELHAGWNVFETKIGVGQQVTGMSESARVQRQSHSTPFV
jgi:hypothetical protein